ncbi:hypothetical protein N7460_006820 [Penicillium canescens]|uniref:Uncharacterized protein n=1 Tax=Penicillium canescens TaxID=5083 RepID=A0AAD6N8F8_PENCN|nr:hypothetical protein N7460_006820 [Penicillium canescens]
MGQAKPKGQSLVHGRSIKTTRRLFRRYTITNDEDDWEEYKSARNRKGRVIKKALWTGFREFVKEAISKGLQGLWRMVQWVSNRGQEPHSALPPLTTGKGIAESTEKKWQHCEMSSS